MKIIIGLGNPGKEYEETRHNVGFKLIDALKETLEFEDFQYKKKFDADISEGEYRDEKIILVKPQTYMNVSGKTVTKITKFYKILYHDMWIIYDDLDFLIGEMKIREKGGPGSHNGMKSVIASIGSENFPRIRIGIMDEKLKNKAYSGRNYVLGKFSKTEQKIIDKTVEKAKDSIVYSFENGVSNAMNQYN